MTRENLGWVVAGLLAVLFSAAGAMTTGSSPGRYTPVACTYQSMQKMSVPGQGLFPEQKSMLANQTIIYSFDTWTGEHKLSPEVK
jgi:hypothetical protein